MNTNTKSNRVMKAMTGLSQYEFNQLVPTFEQELYLHKLARPGCQRKPGGGRKSLGLIGWSRALSMHC